MEILLAARWGRAALRCRANLATSMVQEEETGGRECTDRPEALAQIPRGKTIRGRSLACRFPCNWSQLVLGCTPNILRESERFSNMNNGMMFLIQSNSFVLILIITVG